MQIISQTNQNYVVSTRTESAIPTLPTLQTNFSAPQVHSRIEEPKLLTQNDLHRPTQGILDLIRTKLNIANLSDYVPAIESAHLQLRTTDEDSASVQALQEIYAAANLLITTDVISPDGLARIYLDRCLVTANKARAANMPSLVEKIVVWTLDGLHRANFDRKTKESICKRYLPQFMAGLKIELELTLKLASY